LNLALTPAARALAPELAKLADANDSGFFDHLALQDRAALFHILREIVAKRGLKSVPVE
jgi:hypothetical protein